MPTIIAAHVGSVVLSPPFTQTKRQRLKPSTLCHCVSFVYELFGPVDSRRPGGEDAYNSKLMLQRHLHRPHHRDGNGKNHDVGQDVDNTLPECLFEHVDTIAWHQRVVKLCERPAAES